MRHRDFEARKRVKVDRELPMKDEYAKLLRRVLRAGAPAPDAAAEEGE
jgi:hypothetical protein